MPTDNYRYFRIEARELLDGLAHGMLELEKLGADADALARLLRQAHTLKGAARVVRQPEIAEHAHAIEDLLAPLRGHAGAVDRELLDAVFVVLDQITARVTALDLPAPSTQPRPPTAEPEPVAELDHAETDAVLDAVARLHAEGARLRRALAELGRARQITDLLALRRGRPGSRDGEPRPGGDRAGELVDDLSALLAGLERGSTESLERMERELELTRTAAERLRLVPIAAMFTALGRLARDAAVGAGKQLDFVTRGGEVRLDPQLFGTVHGALVQLISNAVAHGIESPSERAASGKPSAGSVRIEVIRRGARVSFRCIDDGRGIDATAVRAAARRMGVADQQVEQLEAEALLRVLFHAGLSTASGVTELAGRGIGLDVVRAAALRVRGEVTVRTRAGVGTTVELDVPLSISAITALVVGIEDRAAAIPLDSVRRALRLGADDITRTPEGESVLYEGEVIPFLRLAAALDPARARTAGPRSWSAVVVQGAGGAAAIGVDRLLGAHEVVVRPLPELAPAAELVAGASSDLEGNPRLVLDPEALVVRARLASATAPAPARIAPLVLVVDDSLTSRMLERAILESAGFRVDLADSAEQALIRLSEREYAAMLVDVEMPGMDGFSLLEHIRDDPNRRTIPAMMVTSRASPEDRARGERAGARGYIAKGEFDQVAFLARIRELVGE